MTDYLKYLLQVEYRFDKFGVAKVHLLIIKLRSLRIF